MNRPERARTLIYVDMAYSVRFMKHRQQTAFWQSRHSGDYFDKVIGIHPIVDLVEPDTKVPNILRLSKRQLVIEGMAFRSKRAPAPISFLGSQINLLGGIYRKLKHRDVSVVMTTDALYSGLFGFGLARLLGKPLVVSVLGNWDEVYADHGGLAMPRLLPNKRLQDLVQRFVLTRAEQVIIGNQNNREYVLRLGAPVDRTTIVTVAKNLHDIHFSDPAERKNDKSVLKELGLPEDRKILLYVGRLVIEKHPEQALRAMIAVARENSKIVGVLAGEGAMRGSLEAMISDAGLVDRIKILGNIDQITLGRLFPHCIVLAPLTGMALIEAGLGGTPIVAYKRDWHGEFIHHGQSGLLVEAQDWQAMAQAALEIIRDCKLAANFSRSIRERAMDLADKKRISEQERAIYDEVIRRHQSRNLPRRGLRSFLRRSPKRPTAG